VQRLAIMARFTRSSFVDILQEDFIHRAKACRNRWSLPAWTAQRAGRW
jgi:ABC-type dipeptide/oligopeptide/nickel transport system permease component